MNSLLLIEPYELTPIDSGGKQRIAHTIKELSKRFKLTTIILPPQQKHHFSFLRLGMPYWFSDWYYPKIKPQLAKIDYSQINTIMVEFSQLLHLIKYLPKDKRIIFVAHDIATISFNRRLQSEKNLIKKVIGLFRLCEVYLYEKKYLSQYNQVIAVSDHDKQVLKELFGLSKVKVIPNGIATINFLTKRKPDNYLNLGFIGSATHPPNQQAIDYLIKIISPALSKHHIKHRLIIAGSNSVSGKNVTNLGRIENVKDFYQQIDFLVAPIFSGSGSRIKILESLSFGRPVVTTHIGAEGIEITSDYLKIIDSQPESWVQTLLHLSTSPPKQQKQLATQLQPLTWERLFQKFLQNKSTVIEPSELLRTA